MIFGEGGQKSLVLRKIFWLARSPLVPQAHSANGSQSACLWQDVAGSGAAGLGPTLKRRLAEAAELIDTALGAFEPAIHIAQQDRA